MRRLPPQDLSAEQGLIGGVLIYGDGVLPSFAYMLSPDDFYDRRHGKIYEAMLWLLDHGRPIDDKTLTSRLNDTGELQPVGGPGLLAKLADIAIAPAHVEHYATLIKDKARLRGVIEAVERARDAAFDMASDPSAALDEVDRVLMEAREAYRVRPQTHPEIVQSEYAKFDTRARGQKDTTTLALGLDRLNHALSGGLCPGDLMIVAGRPGMGKTGLGLRIAANLSIRQNRHVLYVSYEMPAAQLVNRLYCSEALVPTTAWKTGRVDETQRKKLESARRIISEAPLHWLDGRKTMESVAREARYLKSRHDLSLVVFDHIQRAARKQETPEIAAVSSALKDMALDLNLPVIALSQLNREVERRNPPKPVLSDLRGAGDIEQDADIVALLYRQAYYEDESDSQVVEICIAKNRNGPTGKFDLLFDSECVRFWEVS